MSGLNVTVLGSWLRRKVSSLRTSLRAHARHLIIALGALTLAGLLAAATTIIEPEDRLVVGNTGGTLTVLVELDDSRLLIGAGPSRSHSASLIGSATRPWDRTIDLLLIPGWEDHHAAGAIGLLERRTVNAVAIVGLPGEEPVWTHLERQAEHDDIPVRYLDRTHHVQLADHARMTITPRIRNSEGAWVRLEHHGKRVDVIDVEDPEDATPDPRVMANVNDHVLINMRDQRSPATLSPELLLAPMAHWQHDYTELRSSYWAGIDRNDYAILRLSEDNVSLPLDSVRDVPN